MRILKNNEIIFRSRKKWIYPLFDAEIFIEKFNLNTEEIEIEDKIIGKAAAAFIIKMNVKKIYAHLLSELAKELLEKYNIEYKYDKIVKRINCKTEELFNKEDDVEKIVKILKERVKEN
ncbi:DUF1893 domain-containing protein [Haliovirga abyssi]|nr:DUF1893 domain-containing protein [Haliovirga abyssi]